MHRRLAIVLSIGALLVATGGIPVNGQRPTSSPVQAFDSPLAGARSPRNANYDIDARLDHERRELRGRETIQWRNVSARTATELQFHLYWNAWRNADSTWLREHRLAGNVMPKLPDEAGSSDVSTIRVRQAQSEAALDLTPQIRYLSPDDGNTADRTVMAVALPFGVKPNETLQIEIEWTAKIPFPIARTGRVGSYYFIAQWFPKIGVLDDAGWNTHQFHRSTEFYADFGTYDVRMTLPRRFVLGASGRQTRWTDNADGTTTHTYRGEDIADFAWAASPDFVDLTRTFEHPTLPKVEMRLLLQSERRGQAERYFAITAATLKRYGEWFGAYPYGHVTVVDPAFQSQSDGMEYPTLFTGRSRLLAPRIVQTPEMTTSHEAGHQWWYGIVSTNEFEHAWMDEGINTFATARVLDDVFNPNRVEVRYFDGLIPWALSDVPFSRLDNDRLAGYRLNAESDTPSTPSWQYWPATGSTITYNKTSLWLHTLERYLGWPVVQRILATYFDRWKFRHPLPADFFAVVNEVSGQDLTWFIDQVYRSSNTFDYGVQDLKSERTGSSAYRTVVVVRRLGEATFPVEVVTTFADGQHVTERWSGADRRAIYVYERPARATTVVVDPNRVLLLDVNYTNNSITLEPRAGRASAKWSLTWMVWLQDLMLTYAFLV